jgi:NADH:ubiquinone oxidoreductase subunit K
MPDNEPMLRWVIAIIAGGGAAGTIQASTGLLRLFSTKATLGTGNSLIATGENAAAVTGSIFSFIVPVVVAAIIIVVVLWILFAAIKRLGNSKNKQL